MEYEDKIHKTIADEQKENKKRLIKYTKNLPRVKNWQEKRRQNKRNRKKKKKRMKNIRGQKKKKKDG